MADTQTEPAAVEEEAPKAPLEDAFGRKKQAFEEEVYEKDEKEVIGDYDHDIDDDEPEDGGTSSEADEDSTADDDQDTDDGDSQVPPEMVNLAKDYGFTEQQATSMGVSALAIAIQNAAAKNPAKAEKMVKDEEGDKLAELKLDFDELDKDEFDPQIVKMQGQLKAVVDHLNQRAARLEEATGSMLREFGGRFQAQEHTQQIAAFDAWANGQESYEELLGNGTQGSLKKEFKDNRQKVWQAAQKLQTINRDDDDAVSAWGKELFDQAMFMKFGPQLADVSRTVANKKNAKQKRRMTNRPNTKSGKNRAGSPESRAVAVIDKYQSKAGMNVEGGLEAEEAGF